MVVAADGSGFEVPQESDSGEQEIADHRVAHVALQARDAAEAGIDSETLRYDATIREAELLGVVEALNADDDVDGVLVQLPLPDHVDDRKVIDAIDPAKDVDGFHPENLGRLMIGDPAFVPATPFGIMEMLDRSGIETEGQNAVIVGRSNIVGKPLANLLMQRGTDATVTVCHHMTRDVQVHSRRADVVFVAVGKPDLLTGDMVKPGAAVIDIGINQVVDADGRERVVGDCNYASCYEVAGWITPVPGGVGPVTASILMRNAVVAAQRLKDHYEAQLARRL